MPSSRRGVPDEHLLRETFIQMAHIDGQVFKDVHK